MGIPGVLGVLRGCGMWESGRVRAERRDMKERRNLARRRFLCHGFQTLAWMGAGWLRVIPGLGGGRWRKTGGGDCIAKTNAGRNKRSRLFGESEGDLYESGETNIALKEQKGKYRWGRCFRYVPSRRALRKRKARRGVALPAEPPEEDDRGSKGRLRRRNI